MLATRGGGTLKLGLVCHTVPYVALCWPELDLTRASCDVTGTLEGHCPKGSCSGILFFSSLFLDIVWPPAVQCAVVTTSTSRFLPIFPGSCPISEEIFLYK